MESNPPTETLESALLHEIRGMRSDNKKWTLSATATLAAVIASLSIATWAILDSRNHSVDTARLAEGQVKLTEGQIKLESIVEKFSVEIRESVKSNKF